MAVTARLCAELDPHELFAVTEILPLNEDGVTVMEFVVDDPVQPEGSVHE